MKEQEDLGGICITLGEGEEVEIVVTDIEILRPESTSSQPNRMSEANKE